MKCVVPLAGPDLEHAEHGFRPLTPYNGAPLLQKALQARSWSGALKGSDYVFVVRQVEGIERLEAWLRQIWPGCIIVRLGQLTGGALYSALAGVAQIGSETDLLIIDLADIIFSEGPKDPRDWFFNGVGAVVPCFTSDESIYSYLRKEDDVVVEAAEKRVISNAASAGVYLFRNAETFVHAASNSIRKKSDHAYRGALFVCPMINGVLDMGLRVEAPHLFDVTPVGKIFH